MRRSETTHGHHRERTSCAESPWTIVTDSQLYQLLLNVLLSELDQAFFRVKVAAKTSPAVLHAKEKVLQSIRDNPERTARVLQFIIDRQISVEFPESYIIELADAIRENRRVVLMGPHWSQIDVFAFIKIVQALNAYFKQNGEDIKVRAVGPASAKFVALEKIGTRLDFEGAFFEIVQLLDLILYPVVQSQDKEAREKLGEAVANSITEKGWRDILKEMRQKNTVGAIFPEGTRAVRPGATRPLEKNCELVASLIARKKGAPPLAVPFALLGSHLAWGLEHRNPLHRPELTVAKPMDYTQMTTLVKIVQSYLAKQETANRQFIDRPLHPVEAVYLVSLYSAPEEFWGVYAPAIAILRRLAESMSKGGSLEEFITLLGSSQDHPSRASE